MTTPPDLWLYRARPNPMSRHTFGVVDGDTYDLEVDTGFGQSFRMRARSVTVDTRETWGVDHESEEYARGTAHKTAVKDWLSGAIEGHSGQWPVFIRSRKATGKYGRWLVEVYRRDAEQWLGEYLLEEFDDVSQTGQQRAFSAPPGGDDDG